MRRFWFLWLVGCGLLLIGLGNVVQGTAVARVAPAQAAPFTAESAVLTAGQTFSTAQQIPFAYPSGLQYSDQTNVSSFSTEFTDPILPCLSSSPFSHQGYRSAWYKFTAPASGRLTVETLTNADYRANYDTVIAVHVGTINSLTTIACNDDTTAIFSQVTVDVVQAGEYFVEVVARDFTAGSKPPVLNLTAHISVSTAWETAALLPDPLSGHAVAISGTQAYIVGGFTTLNPIMGTGGDRSGWFRRFDTVTKQFATLPSMPAGPAPGGSGYGYADAVISRNLLHMPTGFVGTNGSYAGTHWVFDFATQQWRVLSAANGQVDPPWGPPPGSNVPGWAALTDYEFGLQRGFYMAGGLRGTFRGGTNAHPSADAYLFLDTGSNYSWVTLPPMNDARYAHTAARFGRDLCVVGGLTVISGGDALLPDGECYKPGGIAPDFIPGWYPTVGSLNVPRYMADSAVGADGRWYVFGGINASGNHVAEVEVLDFNTASWSIVGRNYYLENPALAWPRGSFIGNTLWVFGGHQQGGPAPIPLIQTLEFPSNLVLNRDVYLPVVIKDGAGRTFAQAITLFSGQYAVDTFIPGEGYHIYQFSVPSTKVATITLSNVPAGYDYDLLLYDQNKIFVDLSMNPGTAVDQITRSLPAGTYYILVANTTPTINQNAQAYILQLAIQ